MNHRHRALELPTERTSQNGAEVAPAEVDDFTKLREILSRSSAADVYCRSTLYFAFTGRAKVWTIKDRDNYLVLVRHPNIVSILLVYFPFVSTATDLAEQVRALCNCKSFLTSFQEVRLARIPEPVAIEVLKKDNSLDCRLEIIRETKLDWIYPSYDVCLKGLLEPKGSKLKTYRKKIRKFCDRDIEIVRPKILDQQGRRNAVLGVTKSWIRTKLKSDDALQSFALRRELMAPYRALAQLNDNFTLEIDGLILKRRGAYVAFSLWERPSSGDIVPCIAALPYSHEKSLSEYLYYCTARLLESEGYSCMCIGGSETDTLDQFKKKFDPINAHSLQTMRFSLR
jgi:hypothetical protein